MAALVETAAEMAADIEAGTIIGWAIIAGRVITAAIGIVPAAIGVAAIAVGRRAIIARGADADADRDARIRGCGRGQCRSRYHQGTQSKRPSWRRRLHRRAPCPGSLVRPCRTARLPMGRTQRTGAFNASAFSCRPWLLGRWGSDTGEFERLRGGARVLLWRGRSGDGDHRERWPERLAPRGQYLSGDSGAGQDPAG